LKMGQLVMSAEEQDLSPPPSTQQRRATARQWREGGRGMSYCRFSSANWMSDVYVYEDVMGGWTTHVAGRKWRFPPIPDMPMSVLTWVKGEWNKKHKRVDYPTWRHAVCARIIGRIWHFWHYRVHMASLHLIPLRDIDLAWAGEQFNDSTPSACADRLVILRLTGYTVPQHAIDALRDEATTPPTSADGKGEE